MKTPEDSLQNLLALAARAPRPPEAAGEPPFGLETRVLAGWRAAHEPDEPAFLFLFLRRAMIAASFILLLSLGWSVTQSGVSATGEDAAQLDYQIQMSLNP
ncbi:MAG TPA: hypothetical protein VMU04_02215 [Candidatus Acidoferrum sp.]|nr:hypothetical protein [Candidatus Acidoferrum sp.]